MPKTNSYGQFDDSETLTHHAVAARLTRSVDWVLEHLFFPKDDNGNEIDGVLAWREGDLVWTTGEAIRLHVQSKSKPLRRPRKKGGNINAKTKKTRRTRGGDAGGGDAAG